MELAKQSVSVFNCQCCEKTLTGYTNQTITCDGCDSVIKIVAVNTTMTILKGKIKPKVAPASQLAGALLGLIALGVIQQMKRKTR